MRRMQMDAFSRGDILFDLGRSADEMCFVARGNLHVLSGEDGDSPILTLGKGSIIGQMNLLYTKVTKFKVNRRFEDLCRLLKISMNVPFR